MGGYTLRTRWCLLTRPWFRTLISSFQISSRQSKLPEPMVIREREGKLTVARRRQLSEVKINDLKSLTQAIQALHDKYQIPHVVITSVTLSAPESHLSVV